MGVWTPPEPPPEGEQVVWRTVHAVSAETGLDGRALSKLRLWAGMQMRFAAFRVFEGSTAPVGHSQGSMMPSFRDALAHAARNLAEGREPV